MKMQNKFFVEKALLVDDCDTDNFIHKSFIELSEFAEQVVVKNTGNDALAYLKELENSIERLPDVIFLDINMPRINGYDFLREFSNFPTEMKDKCKVVILSSSESPKDLSLMSQSENVKDYIFKPLTKKELEGLKKSLGFYINYNDSIF